MNVMVMIAAVLGLLLSLGSMGSLVSINMTLAALKRKNKAEVLARYPLVASQESRIQPSWKNIFDGTLCGMSLVAASALSFSNDQEMSLMLLACACIGWALSQFLFGMAHEKSMEAESFIQQFQKEEKKEAQQSDLLFQTIELLSKRVVGIEKRQQSTLNAIGENQKVIAALPEAIQSSLQKGLSQELRPAVQTLVQQVQKNQEQAQQFLNQSSKEQISGVDAIVQSVTQGVQASIGGTLQKTTASFVESVRQQEHTLTRWGRSVEQVIEVFAGIEKTADVLSFGAERMAKASEPVEAASKMFSRAAENLQQTLPSLANVSESYTRAQSVLEQAHISLQRGTDQYVEASVQLRVMVQDLKETHGLAVRRISEGVNEAILEPMKLAGSELTKIQAEQRGTLDKWTKSTELMSNIFSGLEGTVEEISNCAEQLRTAAEPNAVAAKSFLETVQKLEKSIHILDATTKTHSESKEMLESSTRILREGMDGYQVAAQVVNSMVTKLNEAHDFTIGTLQDGVENTLIKSFEQASALFSKSIEQTQEHVQLTMSAGSSSIEKFSKQWTIVLEDARLLFQQSLRQSSDIFARTIEETGARLDSTMDNASQNIDATLQKSSKSMSSSMLSARQQMVDTISAATERLDYSLRQSTEGMTASWKGSGEALSKSIDQASISLQDRITQAGEQMFMQFENACIELVSSAQAASDAIRNGATDVQTQLTGIGGDWEDAITVSSRLLLTSAEESAKKFHGLGDGLQEKTQEAAQVLVDTFQKGSHSIADTLQGAGDHLSEKTQHATQNFTQSLADVQKQWEDAITVSSHHLLTSAEESAKKFHGLGDGLQEKTQEAAQVLVDTFQKGSHSIADTLQSAGDSLSEKTQHATQNFEQSFGNVQKRWEKGVQEHLVAWEEHQKDSVARLESAATGLVSALDDSFKGSAQRFVEAADTSAKTLDKQSKVSIERLDQIGEGMIQSMEQASGLLVRNVEHAGKGFSRSAEQAAERLEQSTARSAVQFDEHFVKSAQVLSNSYKNAGTELERAVHGSTQKLVEGLDKAGGSWQEVMSQTAQSFTSSFSSSTSMLSRSTIDGAQRLESAFSGAEEELRLSLTKLTEQLKESLEGSQTKVSGLLDKVVEDMQSLSKTQGTHIGQWSGIVQEITPVLSDLNQSTVGLNDLVSRLQSAISPVAEAAHSFQIASANIQSVFPNIEDTAAGYQQFNVALSNASESLVSSAHNYQAAGNEMSTLLGDIKQSLVLQTKCNQVFAKTLGQVQASVEAFVPVSSGMQDAAGNVQILSESTAHAVSVIKDATEIQDRSVGQLQEMSQSLIGLFEAQLGQLEHVSHNFVQLQTTLNTGVDAFSEELPQAVDKTLVHFDAAMGKGVARLGSSVERMREAMDDLVEKLETMFEAKKKR